MSDKSTKLLIQDYYNKINRLSFNLKYRAEYWVPEKADGAERECKEYYAQIAALEKSLKNGEKSPFSIKFWVDFG